MLIKDATATIINIIPAIYIVISVKNPSNAGLNIKPILNNNSNILIDTVIKSGDSYGVHVNEFLAYTVTKNVPNGDIIRYRLVNENDEDLTSLIKFFASNTFNDVINNSFVGDEDSVGKAK